MASETKRRTRAGDSAGETTRVFVVDDHPIVRVGVGYVVSEASDISLIGAVEFSQNPWQRVAVENPDVVVSGLRAGLRNEPTDILDALTTLPEVRVLVFGESVDAEFAALVLSIGARGYLSKRRPTRELLTAIRVIATGEYYVSPSTAGEVILGRPRDLDARSRSLSRREREVMTLLGTGISVTDIARKLAISAKTVSTYRSRILTKLGFNNNADIVRFLAWRS